jgi:hypothetical protein
VTDRHIEREDLHRLIAELSAARGRHDQARESGAERLLEQLLKSLSRERRS